MEKVSRKRSSSAEIAESPRSTATANALSVSASAEAWAALLVCLIARFTTDATVMPTMTNTISAIALFASAMVIECTGGMK